MLYSDLRVDKVIKNFDLKISEKVDSFWMWLILPYKYPLMHKQVKVKPNSKKQNIEEFADGVGQYFPRFW